MGNPHDGVNKDYKKSDYSSFFGYLITNNAHKNSKRLIGEVNNIDCKRIIFFDTNIEDPTNLYLKMHPANKKLIAAFKDWSYQAEIIGNVKFFDKNNLSDEDKNYISKNNICIPEKPDLIVGHADKRHFGDNRVPGFYFSRPEEKTAYLAMRKNINIAPGNLYYLCVGHEVGHTVGLEHLHGSQDEIIKLMEKKSYIVNDDKKLVFDNLDNTVMTYQHFYKKDKVRAGKFRTTYEEMDQKAIETIHGTSLSGIDYKHEIKEPRDSVYAISHFKLCTQKIGDFLGISKHEAKKMLDETKVNNNHTTTLPSKINKEAEIIKN